MRLRDYLRQDLVLPNLATTDLETTLRAIADCLSATGAVEDGEAAYQGLLSREAAHTTVLGRGVALPHTTLPGLPELLVMVALSDDPVAFGPADTEPVQLFFVLLSPPGREAEHIKLLARICRLVHDEGFVEDVLSASGPEAALDVIRSVDEKHV